MWFVQFVLRMTSVRRALPLNLDIYYCHFYVVFWQSTSRNSHWPDSTLRDLRSLTKSTLISWFFREQIYRTQKAFYTKYFPLSIYGLKKILINYWQLLTSCFYQLSSLTIILSIYFQNTFVLSRLSMVLSYWYSIAFNITLTNLRFSTQGKYVVAINLIKRVIPLVNTELYSKVYYNIT
jgi:hypothetical protein